MTIRALIIGAALAVALVVVSTAAAEITLYQKELGSDPNYTISDGLGYAASVSISREPPDVFGAPRYAVRDTRRISYSNLASSDEDFCEADLLSGAPFQWTRWVCRYLSRVTVELNDLDDRLVALDVATKFTVAAGTGNDFLQTSNGTDVLRGGAGNDTLFGGANDDTLEGGGGDDLLAGQAGSDSIDGGDGIDTATYATATAQVVVTFDDTANDGVSGEEDNVESNVERLIGGSGNDRLTGSSGANKLRGNGGNDNLRGEGGSDHLLGEGGDDRLTGGAGADRIEGGAGADIVEARGDGAVDTIFCGGGTDVVRADATDRVDISSCEVID